MVWGSMIHHRGCYCNVSYPSEIEDTPVCDPVLSDNNNNQNNLPGSQQPSWLRGWNFTTNLYRILERVMDVIATTRRRTSGVGPPPMQLLEYSIGGAPDPASAPPSSLASVMPYVNGMYDGLPDNFKQVRPMTGNVEKDIDSFQAANIVVTLYVSFAIQPGNFPLKSFPLFLNHA
jgi:hypothetical protein